MLKMGNSNTILQAKRIKQMFPTDSYGKFLSQELHKELETVTTITFDELLRNLYGVFPDDLYQMLSKADRKRIIFNLKENNNTSSLWERIDTNGVIPLPQLANYEWRYTERSAEKNIARLKNEDKICCLGTPTLALKLFDLNKRNSITVMDINAPMIKALQSICSRSNFHWYTYNAINALNERFLNQYDVVFINPPWYLDYYKLFICRAIQMLKDGGRIILPLFPCLSRQHAIDDLIDLDSFINSNLGEICHLDVVDFEMPPFEKEVLRKKKVPLPASNWRTAELISISFGKKVPQKANVPMAVDDLVEWKHYTSAKSNEVLLINKNIFDVLSNNNTLFKNETISSISRSSRNNKCILLWECTTNTIITGLEKQNYGNK